MEIVKDVLMAIGCYTVFFLIAYLIMIIKNKIKYLIKNKLNPKCLCKPHIYKITAQWGDGLMELKCEKCGKKIELYVDIESLEKWFGK